MKRISLRSLCVSVSITGCVGLALIAANAFSVNAVGGKGSTCEPAIPLVGCSTTIGATRELAEGILPGSYVHSNEGYTIQNELPICTQGSTGGAVGTLFFDFDPSTVCVDPDGSLTSVSINSLIGGPAFATATVTGLTMRLSPSFPNVPTSAGNPYVVAYTITDNSGGSTTAHFTVFVYDPPSVTTQAATGVTSDSATLNGI
ncbi:MAG: hypothetical protein AB7F88_01520 [Pyrinomonadaceae bacterium]